MCNVRSLLTTFEPSEKSTILDEFACQIVESCFKIVTQEDLFVESNHGIMLSIAILHAYHIYSIDNSHLKLRSESFLMSSLASIIDDYGMVNENTPMYQGFYVKLLTDTLEFLDWTNSVWEIRPWLEAQRTRVSATYRKMLLADKSTPPLGDGNRSYQTTYRPLVFCQVKSL